MQQHTSSGTQANIILPIRQTPNSAQLGLATSTPQNARLNVHLEQEMHHEGANLRQCISRINALRTKASLPTISISVGTSSGYHANEPLAARLSFPNVAILLSSSPTPCVKETTGGK